VDGALNVVENQCVLRKELTYAPMITKAGRRIVFPMARNWPVHCRRRLADRDGIDDPIKWLSMLAGMAQAVHALPRPQVFHQLFFQEAVPRGGLHRANFHIANEIGKHRGARDHDDKRNCADNVIFEAHVFSSCFRHVGTHSHSLNIAKSHEVKTYRNTCIFQVWLLDRHGYGRLPPKIIFRLDSVRAPSLNLSAPNLWEKVADPQQTSLASAHRFRSSGVPCSSHFLMVA
jgi:hypothetical protein